MSIANLQTELYQEPPVSDMVYNQVAPSRDITDNNFANGSQHYRFNVNGSQRWVPSRSYIRTRLKFTKADGVTPLDKADQIAPAMNCVAGMFQSLEFRINDKTVSRVADYVPQVDSLRTRLNKSRAWLEGTGSSIALWQSSYEDRQNIIASDGGNNNNSESIDLDRNALGFNALTEFTVSTGGVLTQTVDTALPFTSVFIVGDILTIAGTAFVVRTVTNANNLQLEVNAAVTTIGPGTETLVRRRLVAARDAGTIELVWQPPLSIFDYEGAIAAAKLELIMNPQSNANYQKYAIESRGVSKIANTDFRLVVESMYLYNSIVSSDRVDNLKYYLDLKELRCQTDKIDTTSFSSKNLEISQSTRALAIAYQDLRVGNDTRFSASKFKSYGSNLIDGVSVEKRLKRFYVNYANVSKPSPDADPLYSEGVDQTVQRYLDSNIYSGCFYDNGGCEKIEEYHERGSYYYFKWPRDGSDNSSRLQVNQEFDNTLTVGNAPDIVQNMRVLIFDEYSTIIEIEVKDGETMAVRSADA